MAEQGGEQNKTEDASSFKLEQARRKGMVARGADIGFLAVLVALAGGAGMVGRDLVNILAETMRHAFVVGIAEAGEPGRAVAVAGMLSRRVLPPVLGFAVSVIIIVALVEIVQLRGLIFSAAPLKPDFSRLNPAKGLKRIFSLRMLKETAKSVLKMAVYSASVAVFLWAFLLVEGARLRSGAAIATIMIDGAKQLLLIFIVVSAIFAVIDQLLVRREFAKQMRMSRRELTRETRDREGEPRQKQKRKQIHAEYVKQSAAIADVAGSDVLIVNPEHYAVALSYRQGEMEAPQIRTRGRNAFALRMRAEARRLGIPIVQNPGLARALYREGRVGAPIPAASYLAVADIYIMLRRRELERE